MTIKTLALAAFGVLLLQSNVARAELADPVSIGFTIKIDGIEHHPQVITRFGQEAVISQRSESPVAAGYELSVTPQRQPEAHPKAVRLAMVLSKISDGKKILLGSPQIVVLEGKTATMSQGASDGGQAYELSATASTDL